jgi:hypothetical protein
MDSSRGILYQLLLSWDNFGTGDSSGRENYAKSLAASLA